MTIGPDSFAIGGSKGKISRASARRNDDVAGCNFLRAFLIGNLKLPGFHDLAFTHEDGNAVFLHQMRNALVQLFGDSAAALHHGVEVSLDLRGLQSVIAGVLHVVKYLCRAKQCLGRNAAPVETDATQ